MDNFIAAFDMFFQFHVIAGIGLGVFLGIVLGSIPGSPPPWPSPL
jgi:TctA family transporter